jgi:hypothetical protein
VRFVRRDRDAVAKLIRVQLIAEFLAEFFRELLEPAELVLQRFGRLR